MYSTRYEAGFANKNKARSPPRPRITHTRPTDKLISDLRSAKSWKWKWHFEVEVIRAFAVCLLGLGPRRAHRRVDESVQTEAETEETEREKERPPSLGWNGHARIPLDGSVSVGLPLWRAPPSSLGKRRPS